MVPILVQPMQVPVLAARVVLAEGLSIAGTVSRASITCLAGGCLLMVESGFEEL